jgi:hypothetical protein
MLGSILSAHDSKAFWGMAQAVVGQPGKHKALSSKYSTKK